MPSERLTEEELKKLHISKLRNMVRDHPNVSGVAKINRNYLQKSQLVSNMLLAYEKGSQCMKKPILTVRNRHIADCGKPPKLRARKGHFLSYFQNTHGEQCFMQYNRAAKTCRLWMGDVGWEEPLKVVEFQGKVLVLFARSRDEREADNRANEQFINIEGTSSDPAFQESIRQGVYNACREAFGKPSLSDHECEYVSNCPILSKQELATITAIWRMWNPVQ